MRWGPGTRPASSAGRHGVSTVPLALLTEDSREAGVRIEIEPHGAVVLALKKLDRLYGSLMETVDAQGRPAFRLLGFVPVDQGLQEQVPFSLVVHEDRVRAVLGGRPVGELPLAGAAHTMALFVNRATASFRALVVHRPVLQAPKESDPVSDLRSAPRQGRELPLPPLLLSAPAPGLPMGRASTSYGGHRQAD